MMTPFKIGRRIAAVSGALFLLAGCAITSQHIAAPAEATSNASVERASLGEQNAAIEARIDQLLAAMSLDQKIGQIIMPDISTITPDDMRRYGFGSILNGGNTGPGGNERAPVAQWLALADAYWDASTAARADGGPSIPALWATDAVHGHSNVVGATLFPHNIGLGATGNADLVRRIGEATAAEIAVTGIDWTFAPTIAVARDDRWGRTYESYGEDPALVSRLGAAMVEGLQGRRATSDFLGPRHVLATAKHFFGDGGTSGRDQGNTTGQETELIALHAAPYPPAIDAGAQTVMASFSSINGAKMHGSQAYLTNLLRGQMGFDGLVVGDWNGHGQLPGCTNSNCPQALLAGLDIYMVPEEWRTLHGNLAAQVADGTIPMTRLDEAVRRILRVKLRLGLFDRGRPSSRQMAMRPESLGGADHRALARQAVRESLVLLTNRNALLPLDPRARIMVAGPGADDIAMQSGGWTISWQGGGDLTNADFPGAQSIFSGISEQVRAAGGQAILSPEGTYTARPDVAVVVFGERPYAEFAGDIAGLQFADEEPLAMMRRLQAQGIPVVALFLSGRPMWVNRELNAADAFIAAWLPGSEGGGIADLLLRGPGGEARHDFTGRLPMSWPVRCDQFDNNSGASDYAPLFQLGFGLSLRRPVASAAPVLGEGCILLQQPADALVAMRGGATVAPFAAWLESDDGQRNRLIGPRGRSPNGALIVTPRDRLAQEDARELVWTGAAAWLLMADASSGRPPALPTLDNGRELVVEIEMSVVERARGEVWLDCGATCSRRVDLSAEFALAEGKGWRTMRVLARCLTDQPSTLPAAIRLHSAGPLNIQIGAVSIGVGSASTCVS